MDYAVLARFKLGGDGRRPLPGCPGFFMRVDDDVRKCVVFFGIADDLQPNGIQCGGSGFLLNYDGFGYLVTARHVAESLGDAPFLIRMNKTDGTAVNLDADNVGWTFHPDQAVDVAVIPFHITPGSEFDVVYIPVSMLALDDQVQKDSVKMLGSFGPGDLTYTVGLFQLLSGKRRNLPVVHSGSIAAVPRDEKIPVKWPGKSSVVHVEGYLIETQALSGLSGAPVFVRRTLNKSTVPPRILLDARTADPDVFIISAPQKMMHLLGVWQGSWDAPPDDIVAIMSGKNVRVPIGMGIVVPADKIVETLNDPALKLLRDKIRSEVEAKNAANLD